MSFKVRNQIVPDVHSTLTILAGFGTNTATHNNKVFANCRLRILGWRDNNDGFGGVPYIQLSQSGANVVVTATRFGIATSNIVISYAIEEYVNHVIKSIQRSTIDDPGLGLPVTQTVTQIGSYWSITQLGTSTTDNSSGNMSNSGMTLSYDGITTITGTPSANPGAATIRASFELTEWY